MPRAGPGGLFIAGLIGGVGQPEFLDLTGPDISATWSSSLGSEVRYPIRVRMSLWSTYLTLDGIIKNRSRELR